MTDLVLTLIGPDRPGLVEAVASIVAEHGGNWLESRMTHLAGKFAGILRAELPPERVAAAVAALAALDGRGLKVVAEMASRAERAAPERTMDLELLGLDRPGIVREIAQHLAANGVNVEELTTDRTSAPMSGEMLFEARAHVHVPAATDVAKLRAALERVASDLMVEVKLEDRPARGRRRRAARAPLSLAAPDEPRFEALLFDNDGVLVDTEGFYFRANREALAPFGVALDRAAYVELFLRDSRGAWDLLRARDVGEAAIATARAARDRRYVALLGEGELLMPGVAAGLAALAGRHRLAIVTSSEPEPFAAVHARAGILHHFELALTREQYRQRQTPSRAVPARRRAPGHRPRALPRHRRL